MESEINSIQENETLDLVELPMEGTRVRIVMHSPMDELEIMAILAHQWVGALDPRNPRFVSNIETTRLMCSS